MKQLLMVFTFSVVHFTILAQAPVESCDDSLVVSRGIVAGSFGNGYDEFFTVKTADRKALKFPVALEIYNSSGVVVYKKKNYKNNLTVKKLASGSYSYKIIYGRCIVKGVVLVDKPEQEF